MNPRRVKLDKKVGLHFLLDREIDEWLTETAYLLNKTRTQILTEALIWYLSEHNPKPIKKEEKKDESESL